MDLRTKLNKTEKDSKITGSHLPTSCPVLCCLMYHLNEDGHKNQMRWESLKDVLQNIRVFYEKANMPMITDCKAFERIVKLLSENGKFRAIPNKCRSIPASVNKFIKMEDLLAQTFSVWLNNAEELIKNPEDLCFLCSMMSDRLATFISQDKVLARKVHH